MKRIKFKYADSLSNWEWREQSCTIDSVDECIRIYGLLDGDVNYEILEVQELEE